MSEKTYKELSDELLDELALLRGRVQNLLRLVESQADSLRLVESQVDSLNHYRIMDMAGCVDWETWTLYYGDEDDNE